MKTGAYWAGSPLPRDAEAGESPAPLIERSLLAELAGEAPPPEASRSEKWLLALLGLAAFGWIALMVALALGSIGTGLSVAGVVRGISVASGPLALAVVVLILWQRNGSREAQRYADVARGVRMETLALDAVLGLASRRLAEDRAAVAEQADRMMQLADATGQRLAEASATLARQIRELERQNQALDAAAGGARVDIGVLIADLPRAEEQTRALAEAIRAAGLAAHEQAAALEGGLTSLASRAREAEDHAAGAANRLAAQAVQLAGTGEATGRAIEQASIRMDATVAGLFDRAAAAIESGQAGIAAQAEALDAMIERARLAAEEASRRAAQAMGERVTHLGQEIETLAARLTEQDGLGVALVERIERGLSTVDARFAELDESGRTRTERLATALGALGTHTERTMAALKDGGTAATTLINRAETLQGAIAACLASLAERLPTALEAIETQTRRARDAAGAATPEVERLSAAAAEAAAALEAARGAADERAAAIEQLAVRVAERLAGLGQGGKALGAMLAEIETQAGQLADASAPKLVDALLRVRETAGQAAERAREAMGAIVPASAAALGEASRKALETAIGSEVEGQIARVSATSEAALAAVEAASERLEAQLARIADTSASVQQKVDQGRSSVEAADRDNFSRRVALLIDSLNSSAIDVGKLLSSEASDAAWASYLRGDRGVFTRRAVKLIESGEAREITRHYEEEPEFRDNVNRYIHDFEALLRPILAMREGSTLAVVLLSSDMGKLYVALAQAIERLRT